MKKIRKRSILALLGASLCLSSAIFLLTQKPKVNKLSVFDSIYVAQNTYLGPTSPVPGRPQLIQVEIIINDDPKLGGLQIDKVSFNEVSIPLKPRDVNGFRGQGSFQLPPGKYKLKWTVNRDKYAWPRTVSHEEVVHLDPRDLWVQVTIQGEEAEIR